MGSSVSNARKKSASKRDRNGASGRSNHSSSLKSVKSISVDHHHDHEVDSAGFPTRGSMKSIASFYSRSSRGKSSVSNQSVKSSWSSSSSTTSSDTAPLTNKEIKKLKERIKQLEYENKKLKRQNANKLSNSKPQQIKQANNAQKPGSKEYSNPAQHIVKQAVKPAEKPVVKSAIATSTDGSPQAQVKEVDDRNLPQIGDHVVSMWSSSQWQYFTATIQTFDKNTLKYTIEWDDHDPTGRIVDYYNLALDKVPAVDSVGVGSTVLFHQGQYRQQDMGAGIVRSGGLRWHQGVIENVVEDSHGIKRYAGRHTKGAADGKWVTFKDYSERFQNYAIEDFRMPPNVFDVIGLGTGGDDPSSQSSCDEGNQQEFDVFISYAKINCPSAILNREINEDLPPTYEEAMLENMCDPRKIAENLRNKGVRVVAIEEAAEDDYLKIVTSLKKAKVFIACLSDEYANNERCRMEFQYAKKTLKLPVIPLVVGSGSFQWQMTVVGLLIAGDLYIHFKSKDVEESKMTELARALQNVLPDLQITDVQHKATGAGRMPLHADPGVAITGKPVLSGKADLFFSYCWLNSADALDQGQVTTCAGLQWNDPRVLVKKLSQSTGLKTWLDIERLEGATEMGMFGQIATALGECKMVVACVSTEYANSDNCRMEFQFAVKSLNKPTIVLIVGQGDEWRDTLVGKMVLDGMQHFDTQTLTNNTMAEHKIEEITNNISKIMGIEITKPPSVIETQPQTERSRFKAPIFGDHVVCHHHKWAYYLATVVGFNEDDMTYTVDWDDRDPSGRVQSYQDVALDSVPTLEEIGRIGVGSVVFFQQGQYGASIGNNTGGVRWHQGKITSIYNDQYGITRYNGIHTKGDVDGKWITYRGYQRHFENLTGNDLRLSPNAMDALMACRQAFQLRPE